MNKLPSSPDRRQAPSDRRQFGRRWTKMHGWVCVDGRPRIPCVVQNFSETGALLELVSGDPLPKQFVLAIDATKFRTGCEVMRELPGMIGVKFKPMDELSRSVPEVSVPISTYEKLLAMATAEHAMAENAELMRATKAKLNKAG